MSKKCEVTDYKTTRINSFTGGKIQDYTIPNYPESKGDNGLLSRSFIAPDGTYLGNYQDGWWYFKNNMVICKEKPHGVGIILKKPAKSYSWFDNYLKTGEVNVTDILGYYGFSHRGGQTFKIGDRMFEEDYEPKKEDYSAKEWIKFEKDFKAYVKESVKDGWQDSIEEAEKNLQLSDIVPFKLRGSKLIESWAEARDSAVNMSSYLS